MKYTVTLVVLSLFFVSCEPLEVLTIETKGKRNASIAIYGNKQFLNSDGYFGNSKDDSLYKADAAGKIVFRLPDSVHGSLYSTTFYIGDWQPDAVADLAENIDSIVFLNSRRRRVIKGEDDIIHYLRKRRRGFPYKSNIYIKAK